MCDAGMYICAYVYAIFCVVISVRFSSATYTIDENNGILRPLLFLNHSSPFVETVYVMTTDISAEGSLLFDALF